MPYAPSDISSAKKKTPSEIYFRVGKEACVDSPMLNIEVGDAEEITDSTLSLNWGDHRILVSL